MSLELLYQCISLTPREDIREKYLPVILENFSKSNYTIKLKKIEIFIFILTKIPDFRSRH